MNILIIGYVWPEPNSSAAGSRMMQLIHSFLDQHWAITFASPAQFSEHQFDLGSIGVETTQIELNNVSFDDFIANKQPQIVVFDRFMMEEQFGWRVEKFAPHAMRVLNTEDLHCLRQARHDCVKKNKTFEPIDLHNEKTIREVAAIYRSDLTLMISSVEMDILQHHFGVPTEQLYCLPFMLDLSTYDERAQCNPFDGRQHFVSIGNFRHAPNWDAVLQLKNHIWPLIHQQLPTAEMHIYGAYPPPKAMQLHQPKEGFFIKGWAENAKKVVSSARVLLAPLRFGAGIKGKLVEAMEVGTPSVTTSVGAEAMHDELPWNGLIEDNIERFAKQAIRLYTDPIIWKKSQYFGDQILAKKYNKAKLQPLFIERLQTHYEQLESSRRGNFTSMMLRHHTMKSTQYMSQWIEAKNKQH